MLPSVTAPIVEQSWSTWPDGDGVDASWLNNTLAEAQRLHDNCWSVKVESCGFTVEESYDFRFLRWGSCFPSCVACELCLQRTHHQPYSFFNRFKFKYPCSRNLDKDYMLMHLPVLLSSRILQVLRTLFFPSYHSISKAKSILIGSRGLLEALCQRWWGSWLVHRHRQRTDPC